MIGYKTNGVIDFDLVSLPDDWENKKRFFPVIECIEKIPCNPCSFSCPEGAISVTGDITNVPQIDFDKCNGCGICVGKCPGLAIFLVNPNHSQKQGAVIIPYELRPLPEKEDEVILFNREGEEVGLGIVEKIRTSKAFENTPLITVLMDKELVMCVRHIKLV